MAHGKVAGGGDLRGKLPREVRDAVVIRFAGDSGDGMQFTGSQFTQETAMVGNDLATFPDYPAEIRAPAGTTFGVSAFQIHFGVTDISTVGDELDVLVAMNPAALKVNLNDLRIGGTVIVDSGSFTKRNLQKAGFDNNPLEDDSMAPYQVIPLDIGKMTLEAVKDFELSSKEALRSRNMWTLGLTLWMYDRDRQVTINWLRSKFKQRPEIAAANIAALNAGHAFGETAEMPNYAVGYSIVESDIRPGEYRTATGTQTMAWGLLAGAQAAGLKIMFGSYPITPASPLLHALAGLKEFGVITFQAEDEIAAVCSAIGASFAGSLGVTSSSGPGIALKTEALGLAVATELPLVVINSQRAGPSTGMPTKTEQSDLFQAVYGRNGDTPLPVLAAATSTDCFEVAVEAVRIAIKYMTPVMVLTDAYLANAAEPWRIPDIEHLNRYPVRFRSDPEGFQPFLRDTDTLARPWAIPGTPGLEHRIGGIERDSQTGHISYDPENHEQMTRMRAAKIHGIAADTPTQELALGDDSGDLVVVGWGSTFGPIRQAVKRARDEGRAVSHVHLRYLNPLPRNLGDLLGAFTRVLVPEMNNGQLATILRSSFLLPAISLPKISGKPFKVREVAEGIRSALES
ncbi:MAG: 2-oxoacid:acceptor oxidoreductase subunit alpha [Gemmatimonadota bacterium]|nr:MAG: 2-oxoacid:acceptor oxidoreductase subunit alpha [Gemmatimonadota bacterium]